MIPHREATYQVESDGRAAPAGPGFIAWWCVAALPVALMPVFLPHVLFKISAESAAGRQVFMQWTESGWFLVTIRAVALTLQGAAQWLALRPYLPRFQRWIPVTVLAGLSNETLPAGAWGGLLAAAATGAIQALALRGRVRGAAAWIPAVAAGIYLGRLSFSWLSQRVFEQLRNGMGADTIWTASLGASALTALIYGLITGATMVWLLRRSAPANLLPYASQQPGSQF